MNRFLYTGNSTNQISFPLGGIGTGCIGLAGNGRLIDWEIFNKPNKGSVNGFSHFSIKAEADGELLDARVLHGDLSAPYTGDLSSTHYRGFGFGPRREDLSGMPHFRSLELRGEFPFAELSFADEHFPGDVRLVAFNPFIPLNALDSGIPAALFEIEVTNGLVSVMPNACMSGQPTFSHIWSNGSAAGAPPIAVVTTLPLEASLTVLPVFVARTSSSLTAVTAAVCALVSGPSLVPCPSV